MWAEWVGRQLGRYSIEAIIGQGGMGVVLRARDLELLRTVAIKVLHPHLAADRKLLERFRLEAQTAAALRHRNIVAIYDVGHERGSYYLVMEYLEGPALSALIAERGPLPPPRVLDIAGQVAAALDHIHERGLVHRDVKAANILLDQGGRAVLTDFGLVRAAMKSRVTAPGSLLGTPEYLAPEQIAGGEAGPWSDLYALGIVAYEMLSAQVPFDMDSTSALLFRVLWQLPAPLSQAAPGLPEAVDGVLAKMLAKQPGDRYPSGQEFVGALRQALLGGGGAAAPAELSPPQGVAQPAGGAAPAPTPAQTYRPRLPRAKPGRPWPSWLVAVLGAGLVFLGLGGVLLLGNLVFSWAIPPGGEGPLLTASATLPVTPRATTGLLGQPPTPAPTVPASTLPGRTWPVATALSTARATAATETPLMLTPPRVTAVPTALPTVALTPELPTPIPPSAEPSSTALPPTPTPVPPSPVPPTGVPPTSTPLPPTPTPAAPTKTPAPPATPIKTPAPPATPTKTPAPSAH